MSKLYRIFLIEDDEKINGLIKRHLERYGYEVSNVADYSRIKAEFIEAKPDLVLLDINLPYYDGFYWCREIRTVSRVPVIFISARSSDMDQVLAIENGGDDYITKPFSFEVLTAKIKGVIRRAYGEYSEAGCSEVFEIGGLYLHMDQNTVEYKNLRLEFSIKEFLLLHLLLKNTGSIVPREELLEKLWDDTEFIDDNTLSVNVTRVRKKLEELGIKDAIETKRGHGYCINKCW